MLYDLTRPYAEHFFLFNMFRYITFRSAAACATSLVVSFLLGPAVIRWLKSVQRGGQPIRLDGPERHLVEKKGTPTMGGVLILSSLAASTLLWADLRNGYVWAVLLLTSRAACHASDVIKLNAQQVSHVQYSPFMVRSRPTGPTGTDRTSLPDQLGGVDVHIVSRPRARSH